MPAAYSALILDVPRTSHSKAGRLLSFAIWVASNPTIALRSA